MKTQVENMLDRLDQEKPIPFVSPCTIASKKELRRDAEI